MTTPTSPLQSVNDPAIQSTTPWEDALNIFAGGKDGGELKRVPPRSSIVGVSWLKVESAVAYTPPNWYWATVRGEKYWAGANVDEPLDKAMVDFYANTYAILDSLRYQASYGSGGNPVAAPSTLATAGLALKGVMELLQGFAKTLETQRSKVGGKDHDFQGSGAEAFGNFLENLTFKCNDVAGQLVVRDSSAWGQLMDASVVLDLAFVSLLEGLESWRSSSATFTYDLGDLGPVSAPGSQLWMPGGAITAVVQSAGFANDLLQGDSSPQGQESNWRYSAKIATETRNSAFWEWIATAAKNLWVDHLENTLDVAAKSVLTNLAWSYRPAVTYLPVITEPVKLDLNKPKVSPAPGPVPPPPAAPNGRRPPGSTPPVPGRPDAPKVPGGPDGRKPPGARPPLPGRPDAPKVPGRPDGPKPPGETVPPRGAIPPGAIPAPPLPPGRTMPPNPLSRLQVPRGSTVGPDGVVRGPDKKPVLDKLGRQIIVPPGTRVNPDGELLSPNNVRLTEADRLQRPDLGDQTDDRQNESRRSELDKYLKSLRGNDAPSLPTMLSNTPSPAPSLPSLSSGGPQLQHSGSPGAAPHVGSVGTGGPTGSTGGGRHDGVASPTASPGRPVSTEGGPSLLKNQQGGGNQQNGMGGVPFYPPMAGGAGAGAGGGDQNKGERDRTTWLSEDEETWGTDPKLLPSVLGARKRGGRGAGRGAAGQRNYGQGGNDGRVAGESTSPGYGHAEGTA
ncbi:hypothetical protein ABTX61_09115 [Amycolatopsis japonica]|uniref:hypothetical protein n=1 Tax=Amycolatopsis japonica TaxID=208439 RepID=UPI00331714EC